MLFSHDIFGNIISLPEKKSASIPDVQAAQKMSVPVQYKNDFVKIPYLNISPSRLVQYYRYEDLPPRDSSLHNLKENKQYGYLSPSAKKRINNAIDWLIFLAKDKRVYDEIAKREIKFKVNFITLTLPCPQVKSYTLPCGKTLILDSYEKIFPASNLGFGKLNFHYSDHFIKSNLLNQFLIEARKEWKISLYLWKAETQANGNIHFHITTNRYIWHKDLRRVWNRILDKTDMIKRYCAKFNRMTFEEYCKTIDPRKNKSYKKLIKAYEYGILTHWKDPNTTDVHSIRKIDNIAGYFSEYMTKNSDVRRHVEGNLWRLSQALSACRSAITLMSNKVDDEFRWLMNTFPKLTRVKDYATMVFIKIKQIYDLIPNSKIISEFLIYRDSLFKQYSFET